MCIVQNSTKSTRRGRSLIPQTVREYSYSTTTVITPVRRLYPCSTLSRVSVAQVEDVKKTIYIYQGTMIVM